MRVALVRGVFIGSVLVGVLTLAAVALGAGQARHISTTLRYEQGKLVHHPHAPAGDESDVFCDKLTLFNQDRDGFGKAVRARVGAMRFCYRMNQSSTYHGTPSGPSPTMNIRTVTRLPGGTIYAGHKQAPIGSPFVLTVTGGAGDYKGAKGSISISAPPILKKPRSAAFDVTVP